MRDLFEYYDELPADVQQMVDDMNAALEAGKVEAYEVCEVALGRFEEKGYTFEYELDGEPFNLRRVDAVERSFASIDAENGWIMAGGLYLAEIITSDEEGMIAPPNQQEQNARLMSAAPELLEALNTHRDRGKTLLSWANIKDGSPSQSLRDECLLAISNATGAPQEEENRS